MTLPVIKISMYEAKALLANVNFTLDEHPTLTKYEKVVCRKLFKTWPALKKCVEFARLMDACFPTGQPHFKK